MPEQAIDFSVPQRQSRLGIVVYLFKNGRATFSLFFALVAIVSTQPALLFIVPFVLSPIIIFSGVLAYYQYRNFTFSISSDEVIIHKGVFYKERVAVPFERIQSIQITEHIVQRILGLVALRVDTAGSKSSELEIPALSRQLAEILKNQIYSHKAAQNIIGSETDEISEISEVKEATGRVLMHLSIIDLLKVGLTENHLRTGLVALAFVVGTVSQYQDYILEKYRDQVDSYAAQAASLGLRLLIVVGVAYAVFSVLLSVLRVFLRFYDLKVVLKSDAIDVTTGLLKRSEFRVPLQKIQYLRWQSNPLRRMIGFESVKIKPSNSMEQSASSERIEIPALKEYHTAQLVEAVFPDYRLPAMELKANPAAYARFAAALSALIILPGSAGLAYFIHPLLALTSIAVPVISAIAYQYGKRVRLLYDGGHIQVQKGRIFASRIVCQSYKLQALELRQSIFTQRRNLAHVDLYTAAGKLSAMYLDYNEVVEMRDYLLYTVERDDRDWM